MVFGDVSIERLIAGVVALLVGLTFHEFSHALTADQLGDHRPRAMGRLTLNPIAHIDPIGALMLVVAGFGWAKPVMVNTAALRGGRRSMALVAFAGPIANVVVAIAFAVVFRVMDLAGVDSGFFLNLVALIVQLNILLAIFNLIPIPPLDGYNVLLAYLPPRQAVTVQRYAPYGIIVLLLLIFLPGSPLQALLGLATPITRVLIGA
ncbi:MAG TPA: site-2 protease family protein [Candidatus Limnocylindrales bacterium]|nr:site-2 protease family protein [Candidatus Limnocylindrales bacterium]